MVAYYFWQIFSVEVSTATVLCYICYRERFVQILQIEMSVKLR